MFVENLKANQILEFLKTYEDYQNATNINLVFPKECQPDGIILFSVDFSKKPKNSTLKLITATDTKIFHSKDYDWIKFLYSIFGEEYKLWYKEKQEEEFKILFEN